MIKELFHTAQSAMQRQAYLQEALNLSSGTGYLSATQRMCVNQERGALLALVRELEKTGLTTIRFTKTISAPLEAIIKRIYTQQ
jgi:hypothetical protein